MLSERIAEIEAPSPSVCLSRQATVLKALAPVSPVELGRATSVIRGFLNHKGFSEVVLPVFDKFPIEFHGIPIDIPGIGQLRFNTEPEIWQAADDADNFYSVSTLFRREPETNPLRLPAFTIVDFYQIASPTSLFSLFQSMIRDLGEAGITPRFARLPTEEAAFDLVADGPRHPSDRTCLCVTDGYDARHSFFEIDNSGHSTRREMFLITPRGHIELGVFGITGYNHNPSYQLRDPHDSVHPNLRRSGLCVGIERLLLAEKVLSLLD